jgi:hypothetical protein
MGPHSGSRQPFEVLSFSDIRGCSSRVRPSGRLVMAAQEDSCEAGSVAPRQRLHPGSTGPTSSDWRSILLLSTIAILICYADRTNISVAIVPMAREMDWSDTYKGTVLSVFFIGYAMTQVRSSLFQLGIVSP